nr:yrdC domain-containing protein, mitochondrial-like [Dermatophagoides farinae]
MCSKKIFKLKSTLMSNIPLINVAKSLLMCDKVIALPTDTIYGLATHVDSTKGINRLYEIKSRDYNKPLAICMADVDDIAEYGKITIPKSLLYQLLPGAITVIFERTLKLNPSLNPETNLVGIRIPNNEFVRQLCRQSGPIALTSANVSSEPSCLKVEEFEHLWPLIDGIFDGGQLGHQDPQGLGSTVVDFSTEGHYRILRDGCAFKSTEQLIDSYHLKRLL